MKCRISSHRRRNKMSHIESRIEKAFWRTIPKAERAHERWVCLRESRPFYGGPQEGGWWGSDEILVATHRVETIERAEALRAKIESEAAQLSAEARRDFGDRCLRGLEYADEKGLDPSDLPEVDGESRFYVTIEEESPESIFGSRHWE